ncbi:MAG: hypothetical protein LW686_07080 [Ilumatobacteraceae bacterium]|nr:hypothetical protein [Ilumatobacteraceae bacterium]
MSFLPSVQGILVSLFVMSVIRAVWIWRKYDNHRVLRFIGWPGPYGTSGTKEYFWTSGTSGASRAEVERALSPKYAEKYGWLMTVRARRLIIATNVLAWALVIYGGFDLPGSLSYTNGHLSWWAILPIVTWWAARASARVIADAPDELLDERLLAIRNDAYHEAYRFLGVIVSSIAVLAIALDISITESNRDFGGADWTSLAVTLPFVAIWALSSLPSLVLIAKESLEEK